MSGGTSPAYVRAAPQSVAAWRGGRAIPRATFDAHVAAVARARLKSLGYVQ